MKEISALQVSIALVIASLNGSSFNRGLHAIVCRTRFIPDHHARNLGEVAFYIRNHHMFDLELSHRMTRVDVPCSGCGRYRNCSRRGAYKAPFSCIDIVYIDIDISDIEYTVRDSHFYGRPQKTSGSPSRVAHHAESLAVDIPLCPAGATRRGVGRV